MKRAWVSNINCCIYYVKKLLNKQFLLLAGIILQCLFLGVLSGCGTDSINTGFPNDGKIHIVTTLFAPYDFTKNIVQDTADVHMLLAPGEESHSYDPTPQDIITIQNCDLFIYNGGESEEWVESVLNDIPDSVKIVKMMDCDFEKFEEEDVRTEADSLKSESPSDTDDDAESDHEEFDEHVWASPANAIIITEAIEAALEKVADGKSQSVGNDEEVIKKIKQSLTETFRTNCTAYCEKLQKLDDDIRDAVSHAKRKTLVFGDRFPMRYFTEEFGLDYYAAFPGCSADVEASPAVIVELIDTIRKKEIPVVVKMEMSVGRTAETIAEETGAAVETLYVCHNVSKEDFDSGIGYLELMEHNLDVLRKALY